MDGWKTLYLFCTLSFWVSAYSGDMLNFRGATCNDGWWGWWREKYKNISFMKRGIISQKGMSWCKLNITVSIWKESSRMTFHHCLQHLSCPDWINHLHYNTPWEEKRPGHFAKRTGIQQIPGKNAQDSICQLGGCYKNWILRQNHIVPNYRTLTRSPTIVRLKSDGSRLKSCTYIHMYLVKHM